MKRAFFYILVVLGIFSSTHSFAKGTKPLNHLLNISQELFFHQNNSPVQNVYFDADLTEEDNDDVSNSDGKRSSFGKVFFSLDLWLTSTTFDHFVKTNWAERNSFSPPSFYFNSPIVLRL